MLKWQKKSAPTGNYNAVSFRLVSSRTRPRNCHILRFSLFSFLLLLLLLSLCKFQNQKQKNNKTQEPVWEDSGLSKPTHPNPTFIRKRERDKPYQLLSFSTLSFNHPFKPHKILHISFHLSHFTRVSHTQPQTWKILPKKPKKPKC